MLADSYLNKNLFNYSYVHSIIDCETLVNTPMNVNAEFALDFTYYDLCDSISVNMAVPMCYKKDYIWPLPSPTQYCRYKLFYFSYHFSFLDLLLCFFTTLVIIFT